MSWRAEVRKATPSELARETDLLRVLLVAKKHAKDNEPVLKLPYTPKLMHAILRDARQETRRQTFGSRAVRRSSLLKWKSLTELFSDQDTLEERIKKLKASKIKVDAELMDLVDKYLGGWRPDQFDDD